MPERSEVWYTDGNSGFYNVKLAGWPFPATSSAGAAAGDCTGDAGFRSVSATPRGKGVRLSFTRRRPGAVKIEVFQVSQGRRVISERRVARFRGSATWNGRGPDGYYFARFTMTGKDVRRIVLRKRNGRFTRVARHYRRGDCQLLRSFKLERPVFGGRQRTPLRIAYRLTRAAQVTITVVRGKRVVARRTTNSAAGRTYRLALRPSARGVYRVRISGRRRALDAHRETPLAAAQTPRVRPSRPPAPRARRVTRRAAPVAACAALAALSLLLPWALAFDPQVWVAWGHDAFHGHLDTRGGPTWKPLSVLGTTLLAPLDRDAEPVWAAIGRMGGLLALRAPTRWGSGWRGASPGSSPRW